MTLARPTDVITSNHASIQSSAVVIDPVTITAAERLIRNQPVNAIVIASPLSSTTHAPRQ